jgi:hypothetical protein
LGFQADMAHTLLYILGYNAPEDAILPPDWNWSDPKALDRALKTLTDALRPWTIDFHVAQNDGTVKGSGTHDKTGHHCLATDPNGKLDIAHHSGYWLRGEDGAPTRAFQHVCWDGCMFPNATMAKPGTWNDILRAMISVREEHGWTENPPAKASRRDAPIEISARKRSTKRAAGKKRVAKAAARKATRRKVAPKRKPRAGKPARKVAAKRTPAKKGKRRR